MTEIWKDIEGYEGLYQVSNKRNVKSLNYRRTGRERIIKPRKDKNGYLRVVLCKDGECKTYLVHRLAASAFIPNPKELSQVNHRDENKQNNCTENLEWCSSEFNVNYGTRNEKVGKSLSRPIKCVETGTLYASAKEAHEKTGINMGNISSCVNGKKNIARRYHWIKV